MSDEGLDRLHQLLEDPQRQKILMLLEMKGLSFEELMEKLQVDRAELEHQLEVLGDLLEATQDKYELGENGVAKTFGGQYVLTEKGKDALGEMMAFPELKSKNYANAVNEEYFSQKAVTRWNLRFAVVGAALSVIVVLVAVMFLNAPSVSYGRRAFLSFEGDGWPATAVLAFLIAPTVGGVLGYLAGKRNDSKRPMPKWDQ